MEQHVVLTGEVQEGQKRGKALGFPTINFPLTHGISEGIYLSHIVIDDKQYNALTFVGAARTFQQTQLLAETYVFDFHEDVYGKTVTVTLLQKIRDNKTFTSPEALVKQMEIDKQKAEEFFK